MKGKLLRRVFDERLEAFGGEKIAIGDIVDGRLKISQRLRAPDETEHAVCFRSVP
jgi:hypothetical protein